MIYVNIQRGSDTLARVAMPCRPVRGDELYLEDQKFKVIEVGFYLDVEDTVLIAYVE